jgi:hypothetical protein
MRNSVLIFFLILFSLSTVGQKISTKQLENIANQHGVDSALNRIIPFIQIFEIDTAIALSIALKCTYLNYYPRQFIYFMSVGQIIKNETINSIALSNLKSYSILFSETSNKKSKYFVIPDDLLHVLNFQNDKSIIPALKAEFNFWARNADSIKNIYPLKVKKPRFNGTSPSGQLFSDCIENCYKLAWTLNKLGESDFTIDRINAIRQNLAPYVRDYDMERFKFKSYYLKSDTLQLDKSYSSIDEIHFENEIELIKLKENLEGDKCWKQIITNNKVGLYEIGCQWAPRAGQGKTIRLKLIGGNKLQVTVINAWIS